ncbi:MAG: substrate-binding domain-containing protein [Ruminiclostridium sp.]|nr:substrate-binding domain-containing protein [Ruminiclostridium sp.]
MPRKRIAVITARADDAEQKEVLYGIAEAALYADADTVIYSNIYNHWVEDTILNYENIIYSLFEPRHFDGAIITYEAFRDISILDSVVEKLKKAKLPTVIIGGELEDFASVYSDDEADMELMTEHLISHGFTDIDVLTGFKGDRTAERRAYGCKKAFEKHNIPFDERKLHYGDFWNTSGEALAQRYISGELPFPQAVICTNNYMAFGLCDTLLSAGISVPEKLSVTGYDYTGGRTYHLPFLTTMRRNRRKLGHDAVNMLLGCGYSSGDKDRFISGDSCSCGVLSAQLSEELYAERISQYQTMTSSVAQFSSRLTSCKTLAEYTATLSEFFYLLYSTENMHLCLDSDWGGEKFSGEEYLCCKVSADGVCDTPEKFSANDFPPVFSEKCGVYYFSPLCFQTRFFGYTVLRYSYPAGYDFSFRNWSKTVADTLEFLRMKNDIHYLSQCQRASSLYDSLTGFYNLREFRQITEEMQNCSMHAVKLNFASDGEFIYGENYRSDIISAVAGAIKEACTKHEICCRAYDDTFFILCKCDDIFAEKLNVMLFKALGSFDERQVVVSFASSDNTVIDELYETVVTKSEQDSYIVRERLTLQHYNSLLELRKRLITAPHKALTLSEASRKLCVSEGYFRSVYRECFGISYNQESINARLMKACFLLLTTAMSIYSVALNCGYSDEKFFARQFRKFKDCSPMEYRKKVADAL